MVASCCCGASCRWAVAVALVAGLIALPKQLRWRDDATRLAQRMRDAGVDAWCDVYPRMPHVWHRLGPLLPETRRSIEEIGDFIREMIPEPRAEMRAGGGP